MEESGRKVYTVQYQKSPVTSPKKHLVDEGKSLRDFVPKHLWEHAHCFHNGESVDIDFCPKEGDVVNVIIRPEDPTSLLVGFLVAAAAAVVGYMLYRDPGTPDRDDQDERRRISRIDGSRNDFRNNQTVPLVIGKYRSVPPYAVQPYTEPRNREEIFHAVFCPGHGPIKIENVRIGNTPIENFDIRQLEIIDHFENNGDVWSVWTDDVVQRNVGLSMETEDSPGEWIFQSTDGSADEIAVDFEWPQGVVRIADDGGNRWLRAGVELQYSPSGDFDNDRYVVQRKREWINNSTNVASYATYLVDERYWHIPFQIGQGLSSNQQRAFTINNAEHRLENDVLQILSDGSWIDLIEVTDDVVDDNQGFITLYNPPSSLYSSSQTLRGNTTRAILNTIKTRLPENVKGQSLSLRARNLYEGREEDNRFLNTPVFRTIRTIREIPEESRGSFFGGNKPEVYIDGDPYQYFKPALIAVEIRSNEQLRGNIEELNCDVTSCVPEDWSEDWRRWPDLSMKTSENPAELFRWCLQGAGTVNPIPDSQIDLDRLEEWRDYCDEQGWRVGQIVEDEKTMLDVLNKIARTGRATFSFLDGKFSVVQDERQDVPTWVFTPKNSRDFQATYIWPEPEDGVEVEFDNEEVDYQEDRARYTDPDLEPVNITGKYTTLPMWGVTNSDQALQLGRYYYFKSKLEKERYQLKTGLENLVCTRGDWVYIQNDVIDVGVGAGRIKEITANSIIVDEDFDTSDIDEYSEFAIEVRTAQHGVINIPVDRVDDFEWGLEELDEIGNLTVGDLFVIGVRGVEKINAKVSEIEYDDDLNATIKLRQYDERLYDIDEDDLPEFQTNLNPRPDILPPKAPEVIGEYIDFYNVQVVFTVRAKSESNRPLELMTFEYRIVDTEEDEIGEEDDFVFTTLGSATEGVHDFTIGEIQRQSRIDYRVRARGRNNLYSLATEGSLEIPASFPPPNVTGVNGRYTEDGLIVHWNELADPGVRSYEVRKTDIGDWEDPDFDLEEMSEVMGDTVDTRLNVGHINSDAAYLVRAKTRFGEFSQQPSSIMAYYPVPPLAENLRIKTIDYQAVLNWDAADVGEVELLDEDGEELFSTENRPASPFPIKFYEIRTGATYDTGQTQGRTESTSFVILNEESGTINYYVTTDDVARNSTTSLIGSNRYETTSDFSYQPSGFVLQENKRLPLSLEDEENISVISENATTSELDIGFTFADEDIFFSSQFIFWTRSDNALLPIDLERTWEERIELIASNLGIDKEEVSVEQKIEEYPFFLQPTILTGFIQWEIDLLTEISSTQAVIEIRNNDLDGESEINVSVFVRGEQEETWAEVELENNRGTATDFRFVQVRYDVEGTDDKALHRLEELRYVLSVKLDTDQGSEIIDKNDEGGTFIEFNENFIDNRSLVVSADTSLIEGEIDADDVFISTRLDSEFPPQGFFAKAFVLSDVVDEYDNVLIESGSRVTTRCNWQARGAV